MRKRITFEKGRLLKFTSALDMQSIWQRSLKRADLNIEYSQGFHPQPKIQSAVPLPLGFTGRNEIIDIWFANEYTNSEIKCKLIDSLPDGIKTKSIVNVTDNHKALTGLAQFADYKIHLLSDGVDGKNLANSIDLLLGHVSIIRERNNKKYDLRSLIISIKSQTDLHNQINIEMRLLTKPSHTGRPDEVIKELGLKLENCEIERTKVYFEE